MKRKSTVTGISIEYTPLWKRMLNCWPLYLLLLPAIVYYILICYVPIAGNVLAFKDYSFRRGIWGSDWVGLRYFQMFFSSYDCWRLILNTLHIGFIKCILEFPFAIILALLLNEIRAPKFKKITQTITYLPHFLSSVIIVTMMQRILAPNTGVLNQVIAALGGDGSTFWLMQASAFHEILFGMDIWRNIGWDSIIYLAAISGVDTEMYESAVLDGCSRFKQALYITLPSIKSLIVMMLILKIGGLINADFAQILAYIGNNTALYKIGDVIDTYVYRIGIQNLQLSYATAIGMFKGVIALIMLGGANLLAKKIGEDGVF